MRARTRLAFTRLTDKQSSHILEKTAIMWTEPKSGRGRFFKSRKLFYE